MKIIDRTKGGVELSMLSRFVVMIMCMLIGIVILHFNSPIGINTFNIEERTDKIMIMLMMMITANIACFSGLGIVYLINYIIRRKTQS